MADLQTGEIDAYDDQVPQNSFLAACVRDPNIEVTFTPSMRYQALTMNCERFPTNITAFRRAMAFGCDKYRSNVECIGGMGQPIDSYIPLIATDWEVESALTEHFYEADFTSGNASLENAGFKDLDGDGWREYDMNDNGIWDLGIDYGDEGYVNGSIMEVYAIYGSDPAVRACDILVYGLEAMGVRAEIVEMDYNHISDDVFAGNYWVVYQTENIPVINPVKSLYDRFRTGAQWNRDPLIYITLETLLSTLFQIQW